MLRECPTKFPKFRIALRELEMICRAATWQCVANFGMSQCGWECWEPNRNGFQLLRKFPKSGKAASQQLPAHFKGIADGCEPDCNELQQFQIGQTSNCFRKSELFSISEKISKIWKIYPGVERGSNPQFRRIPIRAIIYSGYGEGREVLQFSNCRELSRNHFEPLQFISKRSNIAKPCQPFGSTWDCVRLGWQGSNILKKVYTFATIAEAPGYSLQPRVNVN